MSFDQIITVIPWQIFAMFIPSLFTNCLVNRYGAIRIIFSGITFMLSHSFLLLACNSRVGFVIGLVFVGVGWNFTFISSMQLLIDSFLQDEQLKKQNTHKFVNFTSYCFVSLAAGVLLKYWGLAFLNLTALGLVLLLAFILVRLKNAD